MTESSDIANTVKNAKKYIVLGFCGLGLLIGNLIGLTADSVISALIPLLFAFGGGSVVAFLSKLSPDDRIDASIAVASVSFSCIIGLYFSIFIAENRLLTPLEARVADEKGISSVEARKLLRSEVFECERAVDQKVRTIDSYGYESAYAELKDCYSAP